MSYGITQRYLPPNTGEHVPRNPARNAGARFTYPGGMEGWVYLGGVAGCIPKWYTHPEKVTHPSINWARRWATTLIETNSLPIGHGWKYGEFFYDK